MNEDASTKSNNQAVQEARAIIRKHLRAEDGFEVLQDPLSDDFMNLLEIAFTHGESLFGITF